MKLKLTMSTFGHQKEKKPKDVHLKIVLSFLLCIVLQSFTNLNAQSKINLEVEDQTISVIFKAIEEQTDYMIVYNSSDLNPSKKISIKLKNANINTAMQSILKGLGLTYTIVNDYIAIKKKTTKNESKPKQKDFIEITGKVIDSGGISLPGASIQEEGTTRGTTTDVDGNFKLKVNSKASILKISYVGFKTRRIIVADRIHFNITLEEKEEILDEIVVTGYQTLPLERATGSFAKIESDLLEQRTSNNILDRIEGFSSGIDFVQDHATGRVDVRVRGISSMISPYTDENATQPLYVVDGFPIEGDLLTINPYDVESVTVLKDASAASIWGAKASNGVIVIITKRAGKNEKLKVNFSSIFSITEKINYSEMDWMSPSDNLDMILEFEEKNWYDHSYLVQSGNPISLTDEAFILYNGDAPDGNQWSKAQLEAYWDELRSRDATKDYEKYLLRNAFQQTYNLSVSGGGEKNAFYGSFVFNDNLSSSIGNSNNRFIINLKNTYKYNDNISFTAGLNASLRRAFDNGVSPAIAQQSAPWEILVDDYGQTIPYYNSGTTLLNKWAAAEREELTGISMHNNILEDARNSDITSENLDVRANFALEVKIINGLKFKSSFQYEKGVYNRDEFYSMETSRMRLKAAHFYDISEETFHIPVGTEYYMTKRNSQPWNLRNTLNWNKNINKHNINLFGGMEMRKITYDISWDRKYGYNKKQSTSVYINEADFTSGVITNFRGYRLWENFYEFEDDDIREVSTFVTLGYDFDNKYSFNASYRIDQKNLFGSDPDYRYKPLWSVGGGWNMHSEEFFKPYEWINRLRLRISYGLTGNASNMFSPYAQASNRNFAGGTNLYEYLALTNPANPQLRWEETRVLNYGIDFAIFKNKLFGSLEIYSRKSNDLLSSRIIDPTNGFSSALVNYASMSNKGFELSLNTSILKKEDLGWDVTLNFSYNQNRVTSFDDAISGITNLVASGELAEGKPLENIMSYNYAGLDEFGRPLTYDTEGNAKPYKSEVEVDELLYQGEQIAPYYGGINTKIYYKNFDLTINLLSKFGHKFREYAYGSYYASLGRQLPTYLNDRWQQPGDETQTDIPAIPYNQMINPYSGEYESKWDVFTTGEYWRMGQDFIHDAAFVRVKEITLGYNIPRSVSEKIHIKGLRVTAQVTNPFLWTANKKNLDPELGGIKSAWSNLKTFTFGINATL